MQLSKIQRTCLLVQSKLAKTTLKESSVIKSISQIINIYWYHKKLYQILKIAPDIINTNVKNFPNLISILLLIAIWFRKEFEL